MSTAVIEDLVRRQRYRFAREGEALHVEVWVDPDGDVPEHLHPAQDESWTVVRGNVTFRVGRGQRHLGPGESLTAQNGVRHAFCNTGGQEAHLRVLVEPALDLQEFLEHAATLARAGKFTRRGVPTSPRAMLELADLAYRYRETTVITQPPVAIQRLLLPPLARLERRLAR